MDNSEQKIEKILKSLTEVEPSTESSERMQENVRALIAGRCRSDLQPFLQRHRRAVSAAAAAILAAAGLWILYPPAPPKSQPVPPQSQHLSALGPTSLGSLNAAFEQGGMEAVEKLFHEFMKLKKPSPEITSIEDAANGQSEKEN